MSQEQGNANLDTMNELLRERRAKNGVSLDEENAALKEMYEARHALVLKQEEKLLRLWEELANLRQENEEQARLLGISGSKEARLLAELATLRPAAQALKTAVELGLQLYIFLPKDDIGSPYTQVNRNITEFHNGDPLAATIKAIQRAAEAVHSEENGK